MEFLSKIKRTILDFFEGFIGENNNEKILKSLRDYLISIDVGSELTTKLTEFTLNNLDKDPKESLKTLKDHIKKMFNNRIVSLELKYFLEENKYKGRAIFFIGINGTGKTTAIVKVANYFKKKEKECLIVGCDLFREAAEKQLEEMSRNNDIPFYKLSDDFISSQKKRLNPSTLAYISYQEKKNDYDYILYDTAGRSHINTTLLQELKKTTSIPSTLGAKSSINIFIADVTLGQELIKQYRSFKESVGIDGVILTKADKVKGGIVLRLIEEENCNIFGISDGKDINSYENFDVDKFLDNLLPESLFSIS